MKSPLTGKEMSIFSEAKTLAFRKEEYPVVYHYYLCEDSKEHFTSTELDEINLQQVYNQYRDKHNLPFPEEIKEIRDKYGVSATKMSEILGFGVNSYRNYENGEVPSSSNGKLIQLANDPVMFKNLVEIAGNLDEGLLNKVEAIISKEQDEENHFSFELEEYLLGGDLPDEFTGYRKASFKKLTEMVVFFSEQLNPWKTQMNKLLFYADFLMFKKTCFSISGAKYRAINMGPVINNYNSIYEYIANNDDIDMWLHDFGGEEFAKRKGRDFNSHIFNDVEIEVLQTVANRFEGIGTKSVKTKKIIDISHNEKAWIENEKGGNIISYKYGFSLSQI